jgi:UDP-galactopyranose mutase
MKRAIIIGAGFGGCMPAFLLKQRGWDVTVIDKAGFTGGGVRTFFHGGHPYTFGPRHFITPFPEAYEFLSQYVPMRHIKKINYTYVEPDGRFYTYPVHEDDIDLMPERHRIRQELEALPPEGTQAHNFEEFWVGRVGTTLYEKFVKHYNRKAWLLDSNTQMDWGFEATVKRKPLESGDRYEFRGWINCYPTPHDGYNRFFDLALEGCDVRLNTAIAGYDLERCAVTLQDGTRLRGDIMVSTLSPDELMGYQYGELKYAGREFIKIVLPIERIFPEDVYFIYYPNEADAHTRVVEYKQFTQHRAPDTFLGIEVPSRRNKLYPMMIKSEVERAQRYLDALPDHVFSMGRMGIYRYVDVDDIILQGLEFIKQVESRPKPKRSAEAAQTA